MAIVNVACKLPNGLIIEHQGKRQELKGANTSELINGFGVTAMDADLYNAWLGAHKEFPPVKNGLIFAQASESSIKSQTREHEAVETGSEGIDPENPGKKAKIAPGQVAKAE